ncbi:MAG: hypothetical protein GVY19_00390 [Bacteroidetes bacterium]|jgi:lipopolysaccharide biosynthesis glycosyltransferase|nr:hypothetical protein [Bacteroidota bacterium]
MNNSTSPNERIHIACSIDDGFVMPLAVTLTSLLDNNKHNSIHIHLFSGSLKPENVNKIEHLVHKQKAEFTYYPLDQKLFDNLPLVSGRISHAAYYRIMMPQIINKDVNRFIYMDADVVVLKDLMPLWKTDLEGYMIGAVTDITASEWKLCINLGYDEKFKYFNSGVLLVDKNAWLKFNTTEKVIKFRLDNHEKCRYHDQDGLNGVLYAHRKPLSPVWNQLFPIYFVDRPFVEELYGEDELEAAIKHPSIVHFNTVEKPWHIIDQHPYRHKFRYYLKKSGFKKDNEQITFKKIAKKGYIKLIGWTNYYRGIYTRNKKRLTGIPAYSTQN